MKRGKLAFQLVLYTSFAITNLCLGAIKPVRVLASEDMQRMVPQGYSSSYDSLLDNAIVYTC